MESKEELFINVLKSDISKLSDLNKNQILLYLEICSKMTFKHGIFGIFKNISIYELAKSYDLDTTAIKRTLEKLEKKELLYIVNIKKSLILSKSKLSIDEIKNLIENNFHDFNIRAERLKELKELFKWEIDYKAIYAKKASQAPNPPTVPKKSLTSGFEVSQEIPEHILEAWDEETDRLFPKIS